MQRRFVFAMLLAGLPNAHAADTRCWLRHIVAETGGIRVSVDPASKLQLRLNGAPLPGKAFVAASGTPAVPEPEKLKEIVLRPGDTLELLQLGAHADRCVAEPVIGPTFSGVSLTLWPTAAGTTTPIVLAHVVRADVK